jgi:2-polyprenyl-3-methyl-5-hydroxy-6-metoxy-1,4-benzoquinol methylase
MNNYVGTELALFEKARNWKSYYGQLIQPFLKGSVLEVGAGIGATTQSLCDGSQENWVCLEPDAELAAVIKQKIKLGQLPSCCTAQVGASADLPPQIRFDAIIYIDVLEHIENDHAELVGIIQYLKPSGYLLILSPAHQWLYTPFDKAIGHFRRYNKSSLRQAIPESLQCVALRYLDSVGMLASAGNSLLLKSAMPTAKQLQFWDRLMIPLSRLIDPLVGYRIGKTIVGVWQKIEPSNRQTYSAGLSE